MFGWLTLAAAAASRQKRLRAVSSSRERRHRLQRDGALEPLVAGSPSRPDAALAEWWSDGGGRGGGAGGRGLWPVACGVLAVGRWGGGGGGGVPSVSQR